jgi:hypothetical protein
MGKHKRIGSGGVRIPSDEKLEREGILLSLETQKRIELIRHMRPKKVKIYNADVKRLTAIGEGDFAMGFYRVLNLAQTCWVTQEDLDGLYLIGKGNPRLGLITAIKLAKEQLDVNK